MTFPKSVNCSIKPKTALDQLVAAMEQAFQVEVDTGHLQSIEVMDDYDWDIFHADKLLCRTDGNGLQLFNEALPVSLKSVKGNPHFWWDLPESDLRDELKTLLDLRAMLPVARFELLRHQVTLRNSDEKIVVRLTITSIRNSQTIDADDKNDVLAEDRLFVEVSPLRGYTGPFNVTLKHMQPYIQSELDSLTLKSQLESLGFSPPDIDHGKGDFHISADETVEESIRQMSLRMLKVARQNEQGAIDDIDTEFIHQYRVNLRKTRSLLNLMKKALPVEVHLGLKERLAKLAGVTNDLRDLDVFLLERDYYQQMLPDNFSNGLDRLFKMIARDREKARKVVFTSFQSDEHHAVFDEVVSLLEADPVFINPLSRKPILDVAKKKILGRYEKIRLLGSTIDEQTPDEEVHELRIECKKLRYLMEFFAELFPKKRIKHLIKSLKGLQTILGNFNDYSVQKAFLASYEKNHRKSAELSAAINGLVAVLHQKQIQERTKVQDAFASFNEQDVVTEFTELFGKQTRTAS